MSLPPCLVTIVRNSLIPRAFVDLTHCKCLHHLGDKTKPLCLFPYPPFPQMIKPDHFFTSPPFSDTFSEKGQTLIFACLALPAFIVSFLTLYPLSTLSPQWPLRATARFPVQNHSPALLPLSPEALCPACRSFPSWPFLRLTSPHPLGFRRHVIAPHSPARLHHVTPLSHYPLYHCTQCLEL